MTLKDKVVLITGASRGVGEAMAYGLAEEGAIVAAVARTVALGTGKGAGSLEETVERIKESGGRALAIACDVTDEADVKAMAGRVELELGGVDVLINNAGLSIRGSILDMSVEEFDRVMAVNVRGPFLTCKFIAPSMIERRRGASSTSLQGRRTGQMRTTSLTGPQRQRWTGSRSIWRKT